MYEIGCAFIYPYYIPNSTILQTMNQEKYSMTMTWKSYSDHLKSMMKEMMINNDLSDVTLVTEDKKHISANINILSACSPVFKEILKKDKNSSPIMYLRGIQYSEMDSIMHYIYLGEATFYAERMNEFLSVAKSLEIKELCNVESVSTSYPQVESSLCDQERPTEKLEDITFISDEITEPEAQQKSGGVVDLNYDCDIAQDQDRQTEKLEDETEICDEITETEAQRRGRFVPVSSKYECEQCDKIFGDRTRLNCHKKSVHEVVKYFCGECDYQTSSQSNLTRHNQGRHEGVGHACDHCEYTAASKSTLNRHVQSVHDGVKYEKMCTFVRA